MTEEGGAAGNSGRKDEMKVLVTGFDPFGGEKLNPAYEAVKMLPDRIAGAEIVKVEVPTVFAECGDALERAMDANHPDIVICVGQAGGRSGMTIERVAVNIADARIPDNAGGQPQDEPIRKDGDRAYFATVPTRAMVERIQSRGIPAFLSYTAGTYVCNCIMYHLLYLNERKYPGTTGGFIHVPYECSQTVGKPLGTPSMSLEKIAEALQAAIEAAVEAR